MADGVSPQTAAHKGRGLLRLRPHHRADGQCSEAQEAVWGPRRIRKSGCHAAFLESGAWQMVLLFGLTGFVWLFPVLQIES